MSNPVPPVLTVRYDGSHGTFSAGHDVVVGRDLRADLRVPHPLVSRNHLVLRFEQGRWVGVDNGSLNGIYVDGQRVPLVEIREGQSVNLGSPDGPLISFDLGRNEGRAGRPPETVSMPVVRPATARPGRPAPPPGSVGEAAPYPDPRVGVHPGMQPPYPPPAYPQPPYPPPPYPPPPYQQPYPPYPQQPQPPYPAYGQQGYPQPSYQPPYPPPADPAPYPPLDDHPPAPPPAPRPAEVQTSTPPEVDNLATRMVQILRPGSTSAPEAPSGAITLGRAPDNDIVISDVLASRHHAMLVPSELGVTIRDNRSINGTFVNGVRVGSAFLAEGDQVTIGNVDLEFRGGSLVRHTEAAATTGGLEVRDVCFDVEGGKRLLNDISLTARPGTLTAVVGGSGAGKTTLVRLIAGYTRPSSGSVIFEGHDLHAEYAILRSRIGMVPQDDVVHRQLTVRQALGYAAELRLPPDSSKSDREKAVAQVLDELDLTKHADTRVETLSGGQRKRASVALELLTGPSLLILDEPTSGLDPALDRQVMLMLRALADAGRVVIVVTHSVSYLDICDQILLIAPGGKTAFIGPPDQVEPELGTRNWADIFAQVGADPEQANRRFLAQHDGHNGAQAPVPETPADLGSPPPESLRKQLSTVARRQVRLIVSDRGYTFFLAALPFIVGMVVLFVPGNKPGLGFADPMGAAPTQPQYIMVFLNFGAVFMGVALTIRDLIGERAIFKREQAVGLSTIAYLLAKITVFCAFAVVQAAVATAIVRIGKGAPTMHPQFFGNATLSLFVTVAGTCVASAVLGLALSAFAQTNEQVMPMLVVAVLMQLVLSGGIIPMVDVEGHSKPLDYPSWVTPARWGYAAGSSSIDLPNLVKVPQIHTKDPLWQHTKHIYVLDMAMLAALSVLYSLIVWWKIRLRR